MMAVASIQRYLLIFYHVLLNRHKVLLFHLPLSMCMLLPIIWFPVNIFATSCIQKYNYGRHFCGPPCYTAEPSYAAFFNTVFFTGVPVLVVALSNIFLVIRIIVKKRCMQQNRIWRKNVRMAIQLLSIAVLYLSIWLPLFVFWFITAFSYDASLLAASSNLNNDYFAHLKYIVIFLFPFVTLFGQQAMYPNVLRNIIGIVMPESRPQQLAVRFIARQQNQVAPTIELN